MKSNLLVERPEWETKLVMRQKAHLKKLVIRQRAFLESLVVVSRTDKHHDKDSDESAPPEPLTLGQFFLMESSPATPANLQSAL